jgi:hypothetical protein
MRMPGKLSCSFWLLSLFCVCALPVSARAGVIGAEQYIRTIDRRESLDRIETALAREDIAAELGRLGVDPENALARAQALNDQDLQLLAERLDELPAGGSVLGVVGVVFIVLLILEFVGVIDIFKKV